MQVAALPSMRCIKNCVTRFKRHGAGEPRAALPKS
jgi:hypothetical protein